MRLRLCGGLPEQIMVMITRLPLTGALRQLNAGVSFLKEMTYRMLNTNTKEQVSSMDTGIELRMSANPEYLCIARVMVRRVAKVVGLDNKDDLLTLAVEEALTNIIRHGYGGPCDKPIIVKCNKIEQSSENKAALEIVIRDFGKQVDPESIKARDLSELKPGGFGVHIIYLAMDEVEFARAGDCGMQLRMVKYIEQNT
jgi:anti-sigma regulatory factor (Ser/Thr protein kinase)